MGVWGWSCQESSGDAVGACARPLGDGAGGPASPTVESGEDYVNVPESKESANASLGEWRGGRAPWGGLPGIPLPSLTLL